MKHQPIDVESVSELVEPRLNALKYIRSSDLLENLNVEKEIKRLSDEADRKLRLLKHKADIVRIVLILSNTPSIRNYLGTRTPSTINETIESHVW